MRFFKILRKIKKHFIKYTPLVEVLIFKARLLHNLKEYKKKYSNLLFAPVLKSNAYGHGLVEVAQILDKEKIAFFVLDSLFEATILRNNGIKSSILVVGYTHPENIANCKLRGVSFSITGLEQLKEMSKIVSQEVKLHLKIDTGMHRQGLELDKIEETIRIIKSKNNLKLEGICSHLADADNTEKTFTETQIKKWNGVVSLFKKNFGDIKFTHLENTAGAFYSGKVKSNVIRLGLGLYGINSSPFNKLNLKPVLQIESFVTSVKKLRAGEYVGYNAAYKAEKDILAATVPVGYFEGVDRRLSNKGFFRINKKFLPILGMVSMNITSIEVSSDVKFGDKVVVVSNRSNDKNSVENISKVTGAIPWEILIHIPPHLRRTIIENQIEGSLGRKTSLFINSFL